MPLPQFTESGDLPPGVHRAALAEVLERFGRTPDRRKLLALRLERIYRIAVSTGHLVRFVVFGSFVSIKPDPNDVDVFMIMDDAFKVADVAGENRLLFEHAPAHARFGGSVFWVRRVAAMDGEQATMEDWQIKRDGSNRGIVEIIGE